MLSLSLHTGLSLLTTHVGPAVLGKAKQVRTGRPQHTRVGDRSPVPSERLQGLSARFPGCCDPLFSSKLETQMTSFAIDGHTEPVHFFFLV